MSLNVLVSAAVQRTGQLELSPTSSQNDEASKKKRKRVKAEAAAAASAALPANGGPHEDEEEKQRKRRAQIAEASRRSRARRKKEFQDFKEENDQLWSQNMMLRKTLEDMGVHVPAPLIPRVERGSSTPGAGTSRANSSDEEDNDNDDNQSLSPSPTTSPMATMSVHLPNMLTTSTAAQQLSQTHQWLHLLPSSDATDSAGGMSEPSSTSPASFNEFVMFFERRLSWYFTQLKSDAIRSFASHLPYEEKQKIANLQVKLAAKETMSPMVTPNLALSAIAARQAAANSAEQAVDQDKQVRL